MPGIAREELGFAEGQIALNVSSHDVRVLVLTPVEMEMRDDDIWVARWSGHGIRIPQSKLLAESRKRTRGRTEQRKEELLIV